MDLEPLYGESSLLSALLSDYICSLIRLLSLPPPAGRRPDCSPGRAFCNAAAARKSSPASAAIGDTEKQDLALVGECLGSFGQTRRMRSRGKGGTARRLFAY